LSLSDIQESRDFSRALDAEDPAKGLAGGNCHIGMINISLSQVFKDSLRQLLNRGFNCARVLSIWKEAVIFGRRLEFE
jgi:hypothetical protein